MSETTRERAAHRAVDAHWIDGAWRPASSQRRIEVIEAATEAGIGHVPAGTAEEADRAVAAARAAFPGWAATPLSERIAVLGRIAAGLRERAEEIARSIAAEVGTPLKIARAVQAGLPPRVIDSYVELLADHPFEETVGNSLVLREPIGVVACITPWNYPLHQIVAKVAPAIGAGCTVVVKPSELAPFAAVILAEVSAAAGLPAGVLNVVFGEGPVVGEALADHPQVDMVSFTGSTRAGKRVSELAARTVKRVTLELGGKSANLILDDADLHKAVRAGVSKCYLNSGQTCTALTRMLVPATLREEAVAIAKKVAEGFTLGDPLEGEAVLGPVISEAQRARVRDYIERGLAEGATLVTGGADAPAGLPRGYYVKPTVFADVTPEMTIAREEIFGPVLSILCYGDEEEGIRMANDSPYGLAAAVWSGDPERAKAVARRLSAGQVEVNGGAFNVLAPFGGYRQSGNGRELGRPGLEEYLETKALQL